MEEKPNSNLEKTEQRANTFLERWRGGDAVIESYSVSLRCLTIRIYSGTKPGFMQIAVTVCSHLSGPTAWKNSHTVFYRFSDAKGDFWYLI